MGRPGLTGVSGRGASGGRGGQDPPPSASRDIRFHSRAGAGITPLPPGSHRVRGCPSPQLWVGGLWLPPPPRSRGWTPRPWGSGQHRSPSGRSGGAHEWPGRLSSARRWPFTGIQGVSQGTLRLLPTPNPGLLGSLLCEAAVGAQGPAPEPERPPREAQQVDARVFTRWLALSLPSSGDGGGVGGHRPLLRPKTECRADCPGARVCRVPGGEPVGPEVSQRSCRLWGPVGASCQVLSSVRPTPPPPLRALPWAPPGVSQGALRGGRFPESWRPCALVSGSQTLTCRWSASLRVCVDTSIPLRPSEKRPSLDGSSQEDHRVCTPAPTLFQSVEGPYPALLCPPGASSWTD